MSGRLGCTKFAWSVVGVPFHIRDSPVRPAPVRTVLEHQKCRWLTEPVVTSVLNRLAIVAPTQRKSEAPIVAGTFLLALIALLFVGMRPCVAAPGASVPSVAEAAPLHCASFGTDAYAHSSSLLTARPSGPRISADEWDTPEHLPVSGPRIPQAVCSGSFLQDTASYTVSPLSTLHLGSIVLLL
jgi:hypothetical protein